jgi:protein-S-isoprenylcysteine O-methyltransferase Ste14
MPFQIKAIIFLAATLAFAWLTRASLREVRSHGFYRFFAWEALLVLILLNLERWFVGPLGPRQLASWLLLLISLALAIHGFGLLRSAGKPDPARHDSSLLIVEKTTELVTSGAYRYIRHPLYCSLLCLTAGALLKRPTWQGAVLALAAAILLTLTAKAEETENMRYFGDEYRRYMKRTKMFIPFLF